MTDKAADSATIVIQLIGLKRSTLRVIWVLLIWENNLKHASARSWITHFYLRRHLFRRKSNQQRKMWHCFCWLSSNQHISARRNRTARGDVCHITQYCQITELLFVVFPLNMAPCPSRIFAVHLEMITVHQILRCTLQYDMILMITETKMAAVWIRSVAGSRVFFYCSQC